MEIKKTLNFCESSRVSAMLEIQWTKYSELCAGWRRTWPYCTAMVTDETWISDTWYELLSSSRSRDIFNTLNFLFKSGSWKSIFLVYVLIWAKRNLMVLKLKPLLSLQLLRHIPRVIHRCIRGISNKNAPGSQFSYFSNARWRVPIYFSDFDRLWRREQSCVRGNHRKHVGQTETKKLYSINHIQYHTRQLLLPT